MKKILFSLLLLTTIYCSFLRLSYDLQAEPPAELDIKQIDDHTLTWFQDEVSDDIVKLSKDELIQYAYYENITNFQINLKNNFHNIYPLLEGIDSLNNTLQVLDMDLSQSKTLDVSTFNYWTFPQSLENFSLNLEGNALNDFRYFIKLIPNSFNLRKLNLDFTNIKTEKGDISVQPLTQMFEESFDDVDLTHFTLRISCGYQCRLRKISGLFESLRNQQSFEELYLSFPNVVVESEKERDELIDLIEDLFITRLILRFESFSSKQILRLQRILLQKAQIGELEYLWWSPMGKRESKFFQKKMEELLGKDNVSITHLAEK